MRTNTTPWERMVTEIVASYGERHPVDWVHGLRLRIRRSTPTSKIHLFDRSERCAPARRLRDTEVDPLTVTVDQICHTCLTAVSHQPQRWMRTSTSVGSLVAILSAFDAIDSFAELSVADDPAQTPIRVSEQRIESVQDGCKRARNAGFDELVAYLDDQAACMRAELTEAVRRCAADPAGRASAYAMLLTHKDLTAPLDEHVVKLGARPDVTQVVSAFSGDQAHVEHELFKHLVKKVFERGHGASVETRIDSHVPLREFADLFGDTDKPLAALVREHSAQIVDRLCAAQAPRLYQAVVDSVTRWCASPPAAFAVTDAPSALHYIGEVFGAFDMAGVRVIPCEEVNGRFVVAGPAELAERGIQFAHRSAAGSRSYPPPVRVNQVGGDGLAELLAATAGEYSAQEHDQWVEAAILIAA